jgi:hypothetical protein
MAAHPRYRRTGLFLLRMWVDRAGDDTQSNDSVHWRGKVQRVVDGEVHQFSTLEDLAGILLAMLSRDERRLTP